MRSAPELYVIAGPNGAGKTTFARELAIQRVQDRVRRGGHSVPEPDIRRRFDRGVRNLLQEYNSLVDMWGLFDNSGDLPRPIALSNQGEVVEIDPELFERIRRGLR